MLLKCQACGLEFIILTWRSGAELAAAFGIYGGIEPVKPRKEFKAADGKTYKAPFPLKAAIVPIAEQVTCPECGERGRACMSDYCRARGPINRTFRRG